MVGGPLGDELACSEVVEVDGIALILQPEGQQEISVESEVNQPVFVQGSECFYPINEYSRIVPALCIDWLAELAKGKVGNMSGSLVNLLVAATLTVCFNQEARSSVQ